MKTVYPDPWNFSNTDKNLISHDGNFKVEYGILYEFVMGGPLGGECFLRYGNTKIKLNDFCGGPVIWNSTNNLLALPVWTKDKNQKIEVLDVEKLIITSNKKTFRVLHFELFSKNMLTGIDCPLHLPEKLIFEIDSEEIE